MKIFLLLILYLISGTSFGLPKIISVYLGQNITITCNYPVEYERNTKYVIKVDDNNKIERVLDTDTKFQNGRFSISDDRSAKVLTVNISDIRETDEAFYLFGMWNVQGSVRYYSYFREMWLHVTELRTNIHPTTTDTYLMTSAALIETPSAVCFCSSVIIISVCVCVTLLLIGGFTLIMIYKLRQKRTPDNTPSFSSKENKQYKRHLSTTSNSQTPNSTMAKTKELSKDTRNKIVDLHQAGKTESAIGKGRELADMMERRKVDILCVQETRWKGSKARSIGAGFKLFYYGVDSKRNGVGVVLKEEFVRNVREVGCELEEKEKFWSELDEVMESIPTGERVVIGADFNGHVREGNTGDEVKREEHRVTYKSGARQRMPEPEHRMVVCRMTLMVCKTKRQKLTQALGGQVVLPDDWETTAEVIRETGRKVLGVSSGKRKVDKETWWWNEEVQDSIQKKRLAKKKWDMDRTEENRQEYKELQRRVKREVSKAKQKAYDELYTRLDTREGQKDLYRLARQRDRDGKDVQQVRVIKDKEGRVLTSEESVQRRWKEYFEELMNEENEREKRVEGVNSVEQKVDKIRKDEVRKALKRMKRGKAVGPDDIPVE
ncbi:hypothetical protein QTP70_017710, partial [Hemibagrus guttatus]